MTKFRPRPLKDQIIVITGATSGIGLSTAEMAARAGAYVVLNARNNKELKRVVNKIRETGGAAVSSSGDIADPETALRIRDKALEAYGRIDTWVNNAGVAVYESLLKGDIAAEKKLFETNFWGTRYASDVAVKELRKNGGTLINIGSELSEMTPPVLGIYSASKHAIKAFTDSLRVEVNNQNLPVQICLIRPTSIATPMPEHSKNNLEEGEPSLPSFLYHPDVVATMILRCAVNPKRDIFVGAQARLTSISSTLFPGITDVIAKMRTPAIIRGIARPHQKNEENVETSPESAGKAEGHFDRTVLTSSLYSDLTTLGVRGTLKHYLNRSSTYPL